MCVLACDLALGGAGRLLSGLFCVLLRALVVYSIFCSRSLAVAICRLRRPTRRSVWTSQTERDLVVVVVQLLLFLSRN